MADGVGMKLSVTDMDPAPFERIRAVAKRLGITSDAGAARFALNQFAEGRSIRDFEPAHEECTPAAAGDEG
jgi:hypothetical protein